MSQQFAEAGRKARQCVFEVNLTQRLRRGSGPAWSGRAVQEVSSSPAMRSCINVSDL